MTPPETNTDDHDQPTAEPPNPAQEEPPMSKKALKRLLKAQAWESSKEDRRLRRREKRTAHKLRLRSHRAALIAQGASPSSFRKPAQTSTLAPLAILIDCDFEQFMRERERISLASQVTRAYSDNRQARHRANLWVAGFGGALKERFEGVMGGQYRSWKGVGFCEGGFLEAARRAGEDMRVRAGEMSMPETLLGAQDEDGDANADAEWKRDERREGEEAEAEEVFDPQFKDVVYLSSDSPYTLDRLRANTCYVVGGLVDKNREKGLCYRRARERGIRTARLPIGEFMVMQSRQVLATNHVVEIMLKWMECGDWGEAFLGVIPKRKGGRLRGDGEAEAEAEAEEEEEGEGERDGGEKEKEEEEEEEEEEDEEDGDEEVGLQNEDEWRGEQEQDNTS